MSKHLRIAGTLILPILFLAIYFYTQRPMLSNEDFMHRRIEEEKEGEGNEARAGFPDKMLQWYYEQRSYPTGVIPTEWHQSALMKISQNNVELHKSAASLSWSQLGPRNIGGRVRSIAVDPVNPAVIYVGSVSGGIWKTTNGGGSWLPLKDNMENLSIGALIIDPADHNILYAGTGEGFYNYDALRGEGIFKSTDAGATWKRLPETVNQDFYYINSLAIDKTTGTLFAATRKGLFRSKDGGNSFSVISSLPQASGDPNQNVHCTCIVITYGSPVSIYASFGLFNDATVYKSTDGGDAFRAVFTSKGQGRTVLAAAPSDPNTLYLSAMKISDNTAGIMRVTRDGGNSWDSLKVAGPNISGSSTYTSNQAWYNNTLAIDPQDPNTVYAGGTDFWKSTNGGQTWSQKTNWYPASGFANVHADQHTIVTDPTNPNILYVGTDGGVFKSTDKGNSWVSLNNNLFITQFYYGAVDPVSSKYYGGAQDNGTIKSDGGADWYEILSGDGGAVEVDYSNPNTIYMEYVEMAIFKSTDGGRHYSKVMNGIPKGSDDWAGTTDRVEFIAPFTIDPNNPAVLVAGTYKVYRTTDGAGSWVPISDDLTGDGTNSYGATISTLAIARGDSRVIYAGCSNGVIQVTRDGGSTWSRVSSQLPKLYARRIATDQKDPGTAFVVYSGYNEGNKVFMTTDYGQTWKNISGNLPNIPVNCILVNPQNNSNLVIGTDLGAFITVNGGGSWLQNNDGMANVAVFDLDYRAADGKIFAATHGRGMFSSSWNTTSGLSSGESQLPENFELYQNYPNPFNPATTIKYEIPSAQNVRITVYDVTGREVKELVNDFQQAGRYEVNWDGRTVTGAQAASGIYLYTIRAGSFTQSMKMVLMK
ncbi:MAG: FlgD immunoglobulin-like domain containing protein [Ignavibacteriales bacterium]